MDLKSNETVSLWQVHRRCLRKEVLLPAWQRKPIWNDRKKEKWCRDLRTKKLIPGVLITFHTLENPSVVFMNDGAQRTFATNEFVQRCLAQGIDPESILDKCKITVQHIEYESEQEAIEDFYSINMGTVCTPYELIKGLFVQNLVPFDDIWQPILSKAENVVQSALDSMGCKKPGGREREHKCRRDSLGLLYRFLSRDKEKSSYQVAVAKIDQDQLGSVSNLFEYRLIKLLSQFGYEKSKQGVDNFCKFIEEYTALYEECWKSFDLFGYAPTQTHLRWWFGVAIYSRNNNVNHNRFKDFTLQWIKQTEGKSQLINSTSEKLKSKSLNVNMANMGFIPYVCGILGLTPLGDEEHLTRGKDMMLKRGFHNSHVKSFSQNGEGETVPENAVSNRFRGNRDMTKEEIEKM